LASGDNRGTIRLWDVPDRRALGPALISHRAGVAGVAFGSSGRLLVVRFVDGVIQVWDLVRPQLLKSLTPLFGETSDAAMKPDGTLLASSDQSLQIALWDVDDRRFYPTIDFGLQTSGLAFSGDGTMLAAGGLNGVVDLFDATRHVFLQPTIGPPEVVEPSGVGSLAFSPAGTILAVGGMNGAIHLVGVPGMRPFGMPVMAHVGAVRAMAFGRGGEILASLGLDHTLRLWDLTQQAWQQRACRVANRNLTPDEWQLYMGDLPYHKICPAL
jgi:WD40 repeat protein